MKESRFYLIVILAILLNACASAPKYVELPDTPQPPRKIENVRVALVLGGGGARGIAHLGVIRVLEKHGVPIDLIVGTSAGSIVGALYANYNDSKLLYENLINLDKWEFLDFSFLDTFKFFSDIKAPFQGASLEKFMVNNLTVNNIEELHIPFVAVATDLIKEETYVFASGPIAAAIRASAAIPPFFAPVKAYGKILVDGGVTEPVGIKTARSYNPKVVIAVNISTTGREYSHATMWDITNRALSISFYELSQMQMRDADIAIHPEGDGIGMFDDENRYKLYENGKAAANEQISSILKLLDRKGIKLNTTKY